MVRFSPIGSYLSVEKPKLTSMAKIFKNYSFLIIGFQLIISSAIAQNSTNSKLLPWLGTWKGVLKVDNVDGKKLDFPMTLDIQATDFLNRYSWTIIYGEGSSMQVRPYELLDKGNGKLVMDEKNSIMLDAYLLRNTIVTRFEVKGSLLMITYQLLEAEKQIIFRVYSGKHNPLNTTGGQKKTPVVKTFPMGTMQEAYLRKNR